MPRTDSVVRIEVNGTDHEVTVDNRTTVLDLLREHLGLTGTKKGCDHGQCGACTVLLDGRRMNSCLLLAASASGAAIRTVEGLATGEELHPVQRAFVDCDALQCGYCTPGQICSAVGMLDEVSHAWPSLVTGVASFTGPGDLDADEVRERMNGNLCRCGAYVNIVDAILGVGSDDGRRTVKPFRYERVTDAATAVALVTADPDARFLGGGTNLVDLMKLDVERPGLLVDVSGLDLPGIEVTADGGLRIGAQVRNSDLAVDPAVRERFPVLSQALLSGASGQLRNAATVGGNLFQRTRCLYFQDVSKPCNKRAPGTGCPARAGEHRDLAILGTSDACIATHPSDFAVALVALDARVNVVGVDGVRTVPVTELHRLPGDEPERDTVAAPR